MFGVSFRMASAAQWILILSVASFSPAPTYSSAVTKPPLLIFATGGAICQKSPPFSEGYDSTRNVSGCMLSGFSYQVRAVATHVSQGMLFYSTYDKPRHIWRVKMVDGEKTSIVSRGFAEALAVDWLTDNLYWTNPTYDVILASRLTGEHEVALVHKKAGGIALNPQRWRMYWVDVESTPKIIESRMDGRILRTLVPSGLTQPRQLSVDISSNRLYWSDSAQSTITSISIDSPNDKSALINRQGRTIWGSAVFQGMVAWTESQPETALYWQRINGSIRSSLRISSGNGYDVTAYVDEAQPVIGPAPCGLNNGGCEHLCLPTGSMRKVCRCSHGYSVLANGSCVTRQLEEFLLIADTYQHKLVQLDLETRVVHSLKLPFLENPIAVEYDPRDKRVYWSDVTEISIYSAFLNGTDKRVLSTIVHRIAADGLALDPTADNLYYTNIADGTVGVMPLNGIKTKTLISSGLSKPRDIELDIGNGHMYISEWEAPARILRVDMSGQNNQLFVSGNMRWPNGLSIDVTGKRLYWCDASLDRIERINLDGTNRRVIFSDPGSHFFGIEYDMGFLYLTDWNHRKIRRMKEDGSNAQYISSALFSRPNDLKIYRSSQAQETSACSNGNGGCSDFCLPTPNGHQCACPDKVGLKRDGKTCENSMKREQRCLGHVTNGALSSCRRSSGQSCDFSCFHGYRKRLDKVTCVDGLWNVDLGSVCLANQGNTTLHDESSGVPVFIWAPVVALITVILAVVVTTTAVVFYRKRNNRPGDYTMPMTDPTESPQHVYEHLHM